MEVSSSGATGAAIAAHGKNALTGRALSGPLTTGARMTAPTARPARIPAAAGTFPPPLAGPVGPRERRFSARRAFETFGEDRVGALGSNQLIASRQPANTIVLNRSPAGSSSAPSRAAPRVKPVTPAGRRGAARTGWVTAGAGGSPAGP